jgi:hypothetical protein
LKPLRHKDGLALVMLSLTHALAAPPCLASLGGAPTKFDGTSARHTRVLAAAAPSSGYRVEVTTLPSGTTVREYVGADGLVFAVSWNGPFLPDLRSLLGQHFDTLTSESVRHPKAGHSRVRVEQPDLTIESAGHMRAYTGRAWINSMLPAGFHTGDIQ